MNRKWFRADYQPGLPLYGEKRITASREHCRLSKNAAKEGMVLLKNSPAPSPDAVHRPYDGRTGGVSSEDTRAFSVSRFSFHPDCLDLPASRPLLPLSPGSHIALLGKGTFDYVRGGGGSGEVNVPYEKNLYDGFREHAELVTVDEETASFYRSYVQAQYAAGGVPGMIAEPVLPQGLLERAAARCDTAIVSISRFSGEGWDRKSEFGAPGANGGQGALTRAQNELFARSDFYLSEAEEELIAAVTGCFRRVAVVLNVGGMVATDWIRDNDGIQGALLAFQGGLEGGAAAAELLLGLGNPSGKLSDTFAERLEDYPGVEGFHCSDDYVAYTEDIYVGYRYFETIPGASARVVYPFGYGLSYTTFALEEAALEIRREEETDTANGTADGFSRETRGKTGTQEEILASVNVVNTGDLPGREVVQLYCGAPQGRMGKPARVLCAYQKTRLLQPGESQRITLKADPSELASYDDTGLVAKSAWVLEKGNYRFYLGRDVRSAGLLDGIYSVPADRVVRQLRERMAPSRLTKRLHSDGSYEEVPAGGTPKENLPLTPQSGAGTSVPADGFSDTSSALVGSGGSITRDGIVYEYADGALPEVRYQTHAFRSWSPAAKRKEPQLIDVAQGRMELIEFIRSIPDELLVWLVGGAPNTGVANTFGYGNIPEYGIPNIMTADGPAGVRILPETGVTTTAFPCATLLACTWDPEVTAAVGRAGAEEIRENNLGVWLAPAVNIHRNPLCGRNFEYYSEDPLLAGRQAAAMVRGIQGCGVAATVKHLALNNKETNRRGSDSRAFERSIREIYLRPFEIIVKEAHPWSIMSSYNIINGVRSSENRDLLKGILREEWGWDGMVTTDWWTLGTHHRECAAGNDMKMGCGFPEQLMEAMKKGLITRQDLETAAVHILTLILRVD